MFVLQLINLCVPIANVVFTPDRFTEHMHSFHRGNEMMKAMQDTGGGGNT